MFGSGGRIRTYDLRVMSPTSCHCSTPRHLYSVSIPHFPARHGGDGSGCTDLVSQRVSRQYLRRCTVSRPSSGWGSVGPVRSTHIHSPIFGVPRGGDAHAPAHPTNTHQTSQFSEAALLLLRKPVGGRGVRSPDPPPCGGGCAPARWQRSPRPCAMLTSTPHGASSGTRCFPVVFWGSYLTKSARVVILEPVSHLDAFSGSPFRT